MNINIYELIDELLQSKKNDKRFIREFNSLLISKEIEPIIVIEIMNNRKKITSLSKNQIKTIAKILCDNTQILHNNNLIKKISKGIESLESSDINNKENFLRKCDKIKLFTEYEKNKYDWLVNSNYSINSKKSFWSLFQSYVKLYENAKQKDIFNFISEEIKNLINSNNILSASVKKTLHSCIKKYIDYAIDNNLTNNKENPCKKVNIKEIIDFNKKSVKEQYQPLNDFYRWLDTLYASDIDKMAIIMLRYGINLKDIGKVTWESVNKDKKIITVIKQNNNGVTVLSIPIDKEIKVYVVKLIV